MPSNSQQGSQGVKAIPCKMVNTDKKMSPPKQGSIIIIGKK